MDVTNVTDQIPEIQYFIEQGSGLEDKKKIVKYVYETNIQDHISQNI